MDGLVYHILNQGDGGQLVFHKEKDYDAFIELMELAKQQFPIKICKDLGLESTIKPRGRPPKRKAKK